MEAAAQRSRQITICGLLLVVSTIAIFNYTQTYSDSFIRRDDNFRQPAIQASSSMVRRLENKISMNESVEYSSEPPSSAPSCFRQVQIWRGPKQPVEPKEYECPESDCGIRFVEDTSFVTMNKSDAVVLFHRSRWNWEEMQRRRPLNQAWMFYSLESPRHTGGNAIPPKNTHYYNYTMSYRPSSTIHSPYGLYDTKQPQVPADDHRNWAKGKTGKVVWMASNCGTSSWNRFGFVKKLSHHIKVDIYGACGNLRCNRNSDDCWDRIRSYKFYLAVENSECSDYITEKFWRNALMHDVVPIVYGAQKEDYLKVAPPKSFIHLEDFKSIPELVDYINLLDSNDTLYNSFFQWKRHGSVKFTGEGVALSPQFLCQLVSKIRERENDLLNGKQEERETTPNIHEWWSSSCRKASGFPHNF